MMHQKPDQLNSRLLAIIVAVVNLVVCGGVVAMVAVARGGNASTASPSTGLPSSTSTGQDTETDWPPPSSDDPATTTLVPSDGFQQVTGPGGLITYLPAGWPTKRSTGPGAMQADDPAGTTRLLRYGGAPTNVPDTYEVHADYERQFSANKVNYASIRLERTVVRGMPAIDWEFEYDAADSRRHVRSVYWLSGGYEYFVYASAPVPLWPETQQILDVMLTHSTP